MDDNLKQFLDAQIGEIKKYKWIQSEKVGHDLGDNAVKEWISKYSACFRKQWHKNTDRMK